LAAVVSRRRMRPAAPSSAPADSRRTTSAPGAPALGGGSSCRFRTVARHAAKRLGCRPGGLRRPKAAVGCGVTGMYQASSGHSAASRTRAATSSTGTFCGADQHQPGQEEAMDRDRVRVRAAGRGSWCCPSGATRSGPLTPHATPPGMP
jgi:hypothetical protein